MKAEIADDLLRSDLTTQIAEAITAAITHWQAERFFFNESRLNTFATVATQSTYTSSDDADVPNFFELDYVKLIDSGGIIYTMLRQDPEDMEDLLFTGTSSGRPYSYAYWEESFRLFPIPDAVYTIRPVGHVLKAAPATDGEANNVWMVAGYDLIKAEAKKRLLKNKELNIDLARVEAGSVDEALSRLYRLSSKKTATGHIRPTQF